MTGTAAEIVQKLMKKPQFDAIADEFNRALADEARRRAEFREWLTPSVKAEFIDGEIVMHSPVKKRHYDASGNLFMLLRAFVMKNKLGVVAAEKALVVLGRNDFEPDICFWRKEVADDFHDDFMLHPIPDLVVEILSKGTAARDRGLKFREYAKHGAEEYWIIDPAKRLVEQHFLVRSTSEFGLAGRLKMGDRLRSRAVEGFEIPVAAIFDEAANLEAMKNLI